MKALAVKPSEKRISTSIKLNKKNRDFAKDFFKKYNLTFSFLKLNRQKFLQFFLRWW
jgi:hypothetical protein